MKKEEMKKKLMEDYAEVDKAAIEQIINKAYKAGYQQGINNYSQKASQEQGINTNSHLSEPLWNQERVNALTEVLKYTNETDGEFREKLLVEIMNEFGIKLNEPLEL